MKKIILTLVYTLLLINTKVSAKGECDSYLNSENPIETMKTLLADQSPKSKYCIGAMYFKGLGVEKNMTESFKWIKQSANEDFIEAQALLGVYHMKGEGTSLDNEKAYIWFMKAAKQNNPYAQFNLGCFNYYVKKNYTESIKCFKKAEMQDYEGASEKLSTLFKLLYYKKTDDDDKFEASLFLFDSSGKSFPNETHNKGINKDNYLSITDNEGFSAYLYFSGCVLDKNKHCFKLQEMDAFKQFMAQRKSRIAYYFKQVLCMRV